ncbi:MAG: hypothetical protein HQL06_15335 [Nitrospirae bacterium]|nr:hypothetical protein [Nitrospirota bacterium]
METITFYSYKGGVGRTLALANIANYLSRFKKSVCMIDFDLEAPGLHYKFSNYLKPEAINKGLVDYIHYYVETETLPNSLEGYYYELVPEQPTLGRICLFPAGNLGTSDYWKNLSDIDWRKLLYDPESDGILFFLEFKERIRNELKPDFLLIDSRTGVTETGGICMVLLPEKVVFFLVHNRENIEGARKIMRGIQKAERMESDGPVKLYFVLARIPKPKEPAEKEFETKILNELKDYLNEPASDQQVSTEIEDILILHSDRNLELSELLLLGNEKESVESHLTSEYLRLFSNIIPKELIQPEIKNMLETILTRDNILYNPNKVQEELESLAATYPFNEVYEQLISFYELRNAKSSKILGALHNLWNMTNNFSDSISSKYISIFMNKESTGPFEIEIVKKYLETDPMNIIDEGLRLTSVYNYHLSIGGDKNNIIDMYYWLLNKASDEVNIKKILKKLLELFIRSYMLSNSSNMMNEYIEAKKLFENKKYSEFILQDNELFKSWIYIISYYGKKEEIRILLDNPVMADKIKAIDPQFYSIYMTEQNAV